jgi:hypothetical protein
MQGVTAANALYRDARCEICGNTIRAQFTSPDRRQVRSCPCTRFGDVRPDPSPTARAARLSGERGLIAEVVLDAIAVVRGERHCLGGNADAATARAARVWIATGNRGALSFDFACAVFGLNPHAVRTAVLHHRPSHRTDGGVDTIKQLSRERYLLAEQRKS